MAYPMLSRLQRARAYPVAAEQRDHRAMYSILWDHYLNNGLYDDVTVYIRENTTWGESMRPLRNPAGRSTEFYVSKIAGGPLDAALPIVAVKPALIDAIKLVWRWSNFASNKQLLVRWFACLGDGYIKVAQKGDTKENTRIFFQIIDPRHVCELEKDERGFVTHIRIDVPREVTENNKVVCRYWTEVWTPDTLSIWESHDKADAPVDKLGKPTKSEPNSLGFVPIVHAPFRDIGEVYGLGCFTSVLDQIEEMCRMTTRLHQMMFRYNKPTHVAKTEAFAGKDAVGRPKPIKMPASGEIQIGDDTMMVLPPGTELDLLVPNIDWSAYLATLQAMQTEVESNLPELKYYTLNENAGSSGIALRYMLGDAIDRVVEARGNLFSALIRANQIALTMAQRAGLDEFSTEKIGTYEDGSFDHEIAETPVIALSPRDQADTVDILVRSGVKRSIAMKRNGFTDEEIAEQEAHEQWDREQAAAQAERLVKRAEQNETPASNAPTGVRDEAMPMDSATPAAE